MSRQFLPLLIISYFLLCAMQQNGCKGKKHSSDFGPQAARTMRKVEDLKKKVSQNSIANAAWLNGTARVHAEGAGYSVAVNAQIIWKRDSAIWLAFRKLGIEAARILVTRDSVCVLNRLEKTCTVRSIASLQKDYGLPGGFDALQQTLLGMPWYFPDLVLQSDIRDSLHRLSGANAAWAADYRIREGSFTLANAAFIQKNETRSAGFFFENYKKTAQSGLFPYLRRVEAFSPDGGEMNLEIEFNDIEINVPKTWRFEIPGHYQRL